jgi:hypothetical protein
MRTSLPATYRPRNQSSLRRSVAVLSPGEPARMREEALRLLLNA